MLLLLGCGAVTTTVLVACSDDEPAETNDTADTDSVYVPAEAAAQNPIPPGVAPHTDPDDRPPPPSPKDSGTTPTDSGTTPKSDGGSPDAA